NKTLFDPACGSGSFLVEAAIRLRKEGMNRETAAKRSIVDNLHGSELTGFASRLAELNLIIQILSLIKRIENDEERQTQSFRVCTTDSLMKLYNHEEFEGNDKVAFDTSEFTSTYKDVFIHLIASKNDFDFVVGNPPYVGEKGHKEMFRPLHAHPYWNHFYQGKSDYLYYFIILGLSKLTEGGKLGFITTQYWLTADGAGNLRNYILQHAKIIEIIDFKGIKLFPEAQGQENIVFILEKCSIESERSGNRIKIIQFYKEWANSDQKYIDAQNQVITNYDRFIGLLTNPMQFELFADPDRANFELGKNKRSEIADVFYSGTIQGELDENAWYLYSREKPITLDGNFAFLTDLFNVNQGIVSGADKVTKTNINKIPVAEQKTYGIKPGDPIFIFDKDQLDALHLTVNEMKFVKPFYKNSDIHRGHIDVHEMQFVLYINVCQGEGEIINITNYLQRFRGILDPRREVESGSIRWFDLWWPRDQNIFESEKLVTSRRADENTFAYENKKTYPQSDITLITPKDGTKENLKYLFALLNADFLNAWYGKNTKMKGNMREYYYTPLSNVPIRKIDFDNVDEVFIHDLLGGFYSSIETDDPAYNFDEITQTYIKQKGLTDYYISLKSELYNLRKIGFDFDPEREVTNPELIKVDLFTLADFLLGNHLAQIQFIRDTMLFYPSLINDPTLYSFNSTEKAEVKSLLANCTYFIKTITKDVHIRSVKADRLVSLFNDAGDFGNYGFECSIDFITNDNQIIEVDCKTQVDATYLVVLIQSYLKKSKLLSWETLMSFPVKNQKIDNFIQEKKAIILNALSPLNEKLQNRLLQVFTNREIEPISKINNLNCLQYLINLYVDYLYKGV
ncbi:MAG: N-6 DNA methylase, partial [Bacteroidetes bacterium]|nr:N-6 DNA methylase [Bacteroidota bacterium]